MGNHSTLARFHQSPVWFSVGQRSIEMGKKSCICPQCNQLFEAATSRVNRAVKLQAPIYCGTVCAGLARRSQLTTVERKSAKAEYDREYRERNREKRKQQKAEYYQKTYDPVKAAEKRKERMHLHVAYCRRPEYKEWKREYDRTYLARKNFGEFAEAFLLLQQIEESISTHASRYQIYITNGTINKAQTRRRAL